MEASPRTPSGACPLTSALRVLGGKWKLPLVWHLHDGPLRYGVLRRRLPAISERMLIRSLRELEADGLVKRTQYPEVPPRVEYALTARSHTLVPVLNRLAEWWMDGSAPAQPAPDARSEAPVEEASAREVAPSAPSRPESQ